MKRNKDGSYRGECRGVPFTIHLDPLVKNTPGLEHLYVKALSDEVEFATPELNLDPLINYWLGEIKALGLPDDEAESLRQDFAEFKSEVRRLAMRIEKTIARLRKEAQKAAKKRSALPDRSNRDG